MILYATAAPAQSACRRFHISRNFTADEKCLKAETASDRFGFAIFDANRSKFFRPIQRAENRVRLEYPIENARSAIEPNRLRLAKRKQAGDMIELSIGKQNRVDGRSSDSIFRQQLRK